MMRSVKCVLMVKLGKSKGKSPCKFMPGLVTLSTAALRPTYLG